uniref:DUF1618 domain-containing protein n=1 Tax=Oryza punctata TaxID=4537 RepID=A0A0E0LFM8_ORYPU
MDAAAAEEVASGVLLGVRGYRSAGKNSSTATSRTSTGHPIGVTFWNEPPPALSYFSVHCPDLQLLPDNIFLAPKAIAADDGLLLLRVPVKHFGGKCSLNDNDYFVYHLGPPAPSPKLDLLPWPHCLGDKEIAILGCGGDKDKHKHYVVAALQIRNVFTSTYTLHLYYSSSSCGGGGDEIAGSWTCQEVSVEEPVRDKLCPIPNSAQRQTYHRTTKVITLGGPNGTVGWVDLWRGILLCDLLDEMTPKKLRDMPLPLPAKANWRKYLNGDESFSRDITVSQQKDSIKYVEMEIVSPRAVTTTIPSATPADPDSYLEWVRHRREPQPTQHHFTVHPGRWKLTTWSMPIPHYELLHKLMLNGNNKDEKEAKGASSSSSLSLGCLRMCYPALSCIDDVVYLLCNAACSGESRIRMGGVMVAFDLKNKELRGVAKLHTTKNTLSSIRCYLATAISKHLDTTIDTRVDQAEEDAEAAE